MILKLSINSFFCYLTGSTFSLQILSSLLTVAVLAAPHYDKESRVLEVQRDHWSTLNPHRHGPDYSHEHQRIWDSLLV